MIPEEPEVVSSGDSLELKRCLVVLSDSLIDILMMLSDSLD